MRLRNIPGSREVIGSSPSVVQEPETRKGNWNSVFQNRYPLHIEIGMGKGKFITELAGTNTSINYVGIEKYSSVLLRALEKAGQENGQNNLKFIRMDAEVLTDVFDREEVSKIYLNFSDPWPKDRHAKRRLTSKEFFSRYNMILRTEGCVEFKTDNRELFDFSLEEVLNAGWKLDAFTFDLHNDAVMRIGNVMTEYEEKFSTLGNPICKLIASR